MQIPTSDVESALAGTQQDKSNTYCVHTKCYDLVLGYSRRGVAEIFSFKTSKKHRNTGQARDVLTRLCRASDESGISLVLVAEPLDSSTCKARLLLFYESLGFRATTTKTVLGSPEMFRHAKSIIGESK